MCHVLWKQSNSQVIEKKPIFHWRALSLWPCTHFVDTTNRFHWIHFSVVVVVCWHKNLPMILFSCSISMHYENKTRRAGVEVHFFSFALATCHKTRPCSFLFCSIFPYAKYHLYNAHTIDLPPRFSITIQIVYNAHFLLILHINHNFMMEKRWY